MSYRKRQEFKYAKANLQEKEQYKGVYITEDLTNLRTELLRYIKHECDGNFVSCHTLNGRIRMKRSALKAGVDIEPQGKDVGFD